MSAIFMCDNCGNVFSANETGWRSYTENGTGPEFNNGHNHGARTMHMGPCCAQGTNGGIRPRVLMLENSNGNISDIQMGHNRD